MLGQILKRGLPPLPILAFALAWIALFREVTVDHRLGIERPAIAAGMLSVAVAVYALLRLPPLVGIVAGLGASWWGALAVLDTLSPETAASGGFWAGLAGSWLLAWATVDRLARLSNLPPAAARVVGIAVPFVFGSWILILWEAAVHAFGIPAVLLPAPSAIGVRLVSEVPTLAADFQQTFLKAVLIGWVAGCGLGFLVALVVDRVPFLRRGLLPVGNLVSALPIVGVAPIMVMWFGFDWPSKAAVVVIMTFFPMLVNTVEGLAAAGRMERDLMRTYAASHGQELLKLRLPAAMPFVFNALKINSTLALIGAIVAEFFGTPIVGMGFRISTEVGRMAIDMVWAEIAVAALAGSLFYGAVALVERAVTFWHPSFRR